MINDFSVLRQGLGIYYIVYFIFFSGLLKRQNPLSDNFFLLFVYQKKDLFSGLYSVIPSSPKSISLVFTHNYGSEFFTCGSVTEYLFFLYVVMLHSHIFQMSSTSWNLIFEIFSLENKKQLHGTKTLKYRGYVNCTTLYYTIISSKMYEDWLRN